MRRIGTPDDAAPAVAFLASEGAAYITGETLSVSGGLNMVDHTAVLAMRSGGAIELSSLGRAEASTHSAGRAAHRWARQHMQLGKGQTGEV